MFLLQDGNDTADPLFCTLSGHLHSRLRSAFGAFRPPH